MSNQEWRSIDSLETLKNKDPSVIKWPSYTEEDTRILLPMGEEEMGLYSLTVTKSDSYMGHVFYEVVESYRTLEEASNHSSLYRRDVESSEYGPSLSNLSFFYEFRVKGTRPKKTLISIIP